jgi:peptide deformylase
MKQRIRIYGEDILRKTVEEVKNIDKNIDRLVKDMNYTLRHADAIGLAATQVGALTSVFLALDKDRDRIITAINPRLEDSDGEEIDVEGCLSLPEIYISVQRAKKVVLKAVDERGKEFIIEADGLLARCIQHEIDHLKGRLIIDYASDAEKRFWKEKLDQFLK